MQKIFRIGGVTLLLLVWVVLINTLMDIAQNRSLDMMFAQRSMMGLNQEGQPPSTEVDPELAAKGRELFEVSAGGVGCASCHGSFALGDIEVGPNIRGVSADTIKNALENVEVMEFLASQLKDEDITAIAEYLKYLGTFQPFKSTHKGGVWDPAELKLPVKTKAQVIIQNGDRTICTFAIAESGIEKEEIKGRKSEDFIWTTPDEPATFKGACEEKPEEVLTLIVEVPQPETGGK